MTLYLRVFKSESLMEVWAAVSPGVELGLVETIPILAWSGTLGPKLAEGDLQTPEGFYRVSSESLNPSSRFHRSFDLGFPNAYDSAHGRTGSHLMVHGGAESVGCFAIGDGPVDRVYARVKAATDDGGAVPVHCFPFRMTQENLADHAGSEWIEFWRWELAPAYLWFEETHRVPVVDAEYRLR